MMLASPRLEGGVRLSVGLEGPEDLLVQRIDLVGEVTQVFHDHEVGKAIEEALEGGGVINVYTRSNFGMAFHTFWRDFLSRA